MRILAIETSCDETAAAIVEAKDEGSQINILTNIVASQLKTHTKTGGVIPDVAARMHTEAMTAVLNQATDGKKLDFDAVAVTEGPGLIGCLLIGQSAAKTIAQVTGKPFYPINHLEGHIYSAWLGENRPELPALIAIISGGHSELVLMREHLGYEQIGATRDDAAGEAFDKVARLLNLPYPGGPAIAHLAKEGNDQAYALPISLNERDNLEFSFSGLKAAVAGLVGKLADPLPRHVKADIAASFQKTVADTIAKKTVWTLDKNPDVKSVCLVGGVAANEHLRVRLEQTLHIFNPAIKYFVPEFKYCTDNAAMIGAAAVFHTLYGQPTPWQDLAADPNLALNSVKISKS